MITRDGTTRRYSRAIRIAVAGRKSKGTGMRRTLLLGMWSGLVGIIAGGAARAADDDAEVMAAIAAWVVAFDARDGAPIAALYAPDAVFWRTVSKTIRTTPDEVLAYARSATAFGRS